LKIFFFELAFAFALEGQAFLTSGSQGSWHVGHCTKVTDSKAAAFGGSVSLLPSALGAEKPAENLS